MDKTAKPNWLQTCRKYTDYAVKLIYEEAPDDTFGWGATFQQMWTEAFHPNGLLLTGADGCGKHTAAAHMLRILLEENYECVIINNDVVSADNSIPEMKSWLNENIDQKHKLCVVVDQLTDTTKRGELFSYFGQRFSQNRITQTQKNALFLIVIENEETCIPALLRRNLLRCVMSLPTAEFRQVFLENYMNNTFKINLKYYANDELLKCTEGFTYAQLKDLAYQIGLMIRMDDSEGIEEYIVQLAKDQAPDRVKYSVTEKLCDFIDMLPNFIQNLEDNSAAHAEHLVKELSGLVSKLMSHSEPNSGNDKRNMQPQPEANVPIDSNHFRSREKERINNMAPSELWEDLFGALQNEAD